MKVALFSLLIICYAATAYPQRVYTIDASAVPAKPRSGHLKMGGTNNKGQTIMVNNEYIELNGKPWIPITGEFHYSRYPRQYWDESFKKMKAGGINTVATYVFWNVHEQKEGIFDWSGNKDLKEFLRLCAKNELYAIVRIGPFAHGEIKNGGLPDWLLGRPLMIRSNDPKYLAYVERFYTAIGQELKGTYFKDGGPVIGIQLENEFQHSAAPWGLMYPGQPLDFTAAERDLAVTQQGVGASREKNPYAELGNDHMRTLKSLALHAGMDVPIYTATGWGNAAIIPNETIPVTAAYAYPFWTPKKDISPFFLYKDMHKSPDYAPVRYKAEDYPVFPAELGSGIMSVYTRRPIAVHKSFDAMINRCLGSGANGVGYYMYHGGSTPHNGSYYFSDEAYGLPKISYDFQAPIGEFGQVREGYQRLKLLHYFMNDFGELLAPMQSIFPLNAASLVPENVTDLRYAVRSNGTSGFLFINNFQDDTIMTAKKSLRFSIKTATGLVELPSTGTFDLQTDENVIFPFNLDIDGVNLRYATAQLMAKSPDKKDPYMVFFTPGGITPEFLFTGTGFSIKSLNAANLTRSKSGMLVKCTRDRAQFILTKGGKSTRILVLTKETALNAYQAYLGGRKRFIFSANTIITDENAVTVLSRANSYSVEIYPKLPIKPSASSGTLTVVPDGVPGFSVFRIELPKQEFSVQKTQISNKKIAITLPDLAVGLNDIFLTIDYTGDTAMGFLDGELVADEFFKGIPWEIGLRNFLRETKSREMVFYFRPISSNSTYLNDLVPATVPKFDSTGSMLKVNSVKFIPEYKTIMSF